MPIYRYTTSDSQTTASANIQFYNNTGTADASTFMPHGYIYYQPQQRTQYVAQYVEVDTETKKEKIARREREAAAVRAAQAAEKLLQDNLSEQRYKEVKDTGNISVDSAKYTGRKYTLHKHTHMIDVLEGGRVIDRLCIHFAGDYHADCPAADRLLGQLVLLEANEELVLKTANHNPVGVR